MGELRMRLGDNPAISEVVDHFINENITEERYLIGYAMRCEFQREWPKRVGKSTMKEVCKEIAARYNRSWSSVYDHAVYVVSGRKKRSKRKK